MDPFERTRAALKVMENVFRCDLCFETCPVLFKVAKCPDYFCHSCAEDNECYCPICKVPSRASDVHADRLTAVLSEEFATLRTLIKEADDWKNRSTDQPKSVTCKPMATNVQFNGLFGIAPRMDVHDDSMERQGLKSSLSGIAPALSRKLANAKTYATAINRSYIRKNLRTSFEKSNSSLLTTASAPGRKLTSTKANANVKKRSYTRKSLRKNSEIQDIASKSTDSKTVFVPSVSELILDGTVSSSAESQAASTTLIGGQTKNQPQKRGRKSANNKIQPGESSSFANTESPSPLSNVNSLSNVKMRDKLGNSRLQLACLSKCESSVLEDVKKYLFEDGVNPNERDNNNWTPLHEASSRGHNKIVELLLKRGAVVDAVGGDDCITPLHDAIINSHLETVRILLNFGASTIQRNVRGATAFDMTSDGKILSLLHHYRDNPVVQETPAFSTPNRKEVCLCFTSAAREAYSASVVNLATLNLANISFKNEISEKVTHLIVTDKTCRRTLKFFAALALGKWIVTGDWLHECYKKRQLVPESAFEVIGTNVDPLACGPKLSRENNLWLLPPLFASIHVYCRDLNPNWENDLKKVLQYSGAKIVSREPRSDTDLLSEYNTVLFHTDPDSPESKVNFLIIYDSENEEQMKKDALENGLTKKYVAPKRLNTQRIKTVPTFWFFDCLQSFKILPFPDSEPSKDGGDESFSITP